MKDGMEWSGSRRTEGRMEMKGGIYAGATTVPDHDDYGMNFTLFISAYTKASRERERESGNGLGRGRVGFRWKRRADLGSLLSAVAAAAAFRQMG